MGRQLAEIQVLAAVACVLAYALVGRRRRSVHVVTGGHQRRTFARADEKPDTRQARRTAWRFTRRTSSARGRGSAR